ncbi:hypothetical protein BDZ89DRAFT_1034658 [Hymenopellis radicata]|nr:hypothetical protein BDZ89DRAFT_1034658 [Hymenopellis radicata]
MTMIPSCHPDDDESRTTTRPDTTITTGDSDARTTYHEMRMILDSYGHKHHYHHGPSQTQQRPGGREVLRLALGSVPRLAELSSAAARRSHVLAFDLKVHRHTTNPFPLEESLRRAIFLILIDKVIPPRGRLWRHDRRQPHTKAPTHSTDDPLNDDKSSVIIIPSIYLGTIIGVSTSLTSLSSKFAMRPFPISLRAGEGEAMATRLWMQTSITSDGFSFSIDDGGCLWPSSSFFVLLAFSVFLRISELEEHRSPKPRKFGSTRKVAERVSVCFALVARALDDYGATLRLLRDGAI